MKTSARLIYPEIEIPYARFEAKNTLEQTLKIVFVLKFNFNLILAVNGFHLNRRIQNILKRTGNLSVFLRHGSLRLSVLIFLSGEQPRQSLGFANRQLFLNQLTRQGARVLLSWGWKG